MKNSQFTPSNDKLVDLVRFLRVRSKFFAIPAAVALGTMPMAQAAILDWDPVTGGGTLGGTGTWDNGVAANWWNGSADVAWNSLSGDVARFGGTAGPVTIGAGGVSAYGLVFNSGGYILSGAGLTLNDPLATSLKPAVQVTNLADTATISSIIAGTNGIEKTGAGTLVLGGGNTISGSGLISAGTVRLTNVAGLGTTDTTVIAGGILEAATNGGTLTNGIILDGGVFRYSGTGQLSLAGGKALNLTSNSTIQMDAAGTGGKLFLSANQLAGSVGTVLTKTGNGMIQLSGANPGFLSTSTVLNGGLIEYQNVDALGTGTQTVTLNNGTEFVSSGVAVRHDFALNSGATISSNSLGSTDFTGALTLNGNTTAALRMFHQTGSPGAFRISGSLAGTGNLIVTGAPTALQTAVAGPPTAAAPGALVGQSGLYLTGTTTGYSGSFVLGNLGRLATVPTTSYDPLGSNTVNFQGGTLALSADLSGGALANAGFLGRYFNGGNSVIGGLDIGSLTTVLTRNDATIDSANNAGGGYTPAVAGLNASNIGATWSGALNITTAGVYNFNSNSDDGSSIFVDGMPVAVNDVGQGQNQRGSAITLSAGLHSVVIKWGQGTGGAAMQASYSGPDTTNTNVRIGSVASSVTNSGSAIIGTNTIDNPIMVSPSLAGTIDLAAVNVTSTGALTVNPGGTFAVTGQTGLETLTQSGTVTLNGMSQFVTGTNGAALLGNSSRADIVLSGTVGEGSAGSSILKSGTGTLTLAGTNNFTGTAFSGQGVLALNSAVNGVGATSVAGATTGTVKWLAGNLVSDTAKISLYGVAGLGGGLADLNGQSDTVGGVVVINNQASSGVTLQTGAGTLTLGGDMLVLGSSTGTNAVTGNLNLGGAARNVTIWGQNNTNISAVLSNGDLVKEGRGQLTLSGANAAWAGLTTVNNGRLSVTGVDALGSSSAGTTVNAGGFVDIANITIAEPMTINGKGQPFLSNTGVPAYGLIYTGALQGSGGFAANASGPITIGSAGTGIGAVPGSLLTVSGVIGDGGNNYGLSIAQGNAAAVIGTAVVTGGPGIVKLTAANTFTGPLVVEAGDLWLANAGGASLATTSVTIGNGRADATLTMANSNQFAAGTILNFANGSKNAKFQLNGTTQTVAGFNVSGSIAIIQNHEGAAPGAGTLIINNPTDTSFNGLIRDQNNVLAVTKTGVGTMTFSGNGIRGTDQVTYSGATTVNAGKLIISDSTNFNSPITLNTGGAVTAALEFNESFGRTTSYSKIITDNGLGFTKTGLGNLTLSNLNVVTGTVNVNAGTLNLTDATGNVNPLPNAPINVAAGAQLQFYGVTLVNTTFNNNVTLNGMSNGGALAGSVVGGSPTNTLTGTLTLAATSNISTGWSDKTFNISGKITGAGGLVFDKLLFTQAPGVFNIQNATNDYAGGTTINTGTVQFTTGALPGGNLKFGGTYGNGGNFGVGQYVLSATAGSSFTRAIGTGAGQVQFTGDGGGFSAIGAPATVNFGGAGAAIDWQGTGTTGMDANASLVMNMGTGANNTIAVANDINLNTGVRRLVTNTSQVTYSGVISGSSTLIVDGGGQTNFTGASANTASGLTNVSGGGTLFLNKTGVLAINGDIHAGKIGANGVVLLGANEQIADTATMTFQGQNAANGWLRLGGFTETLAAIQDRSGGGVIENSAGGSGVGTIIIGGSGDSFFNGFIRNTSGTVALTKNGTGTLTISSGQQSGTTNQAYTGATNVNGGTLKLVNTESFNSAITVTGLTSNIEFAPTINRTHTYGLVIGGTGNVVKSGVGTMVLSGAANSYSGLTTVNNGILQITNTQAAGHTGGYVVNTGGILQIGNGTTAGVLSNNNAITVNAGGTLAFSRNNAITQSSIISGAGNVLSRTGGGVITLSGANTYTGTTQVNAGQINLAGNGASAGGLTVYNGGTLNLDFTLAGSTATGIVAATAPVSLNGGTLVITGSASANTQALGTLTFRANLPGGLPGLNPSQSGSGVSNVNLTSGAGGLNVTLGAISHVTGATANFILPALGTVTTSGTAIGGIANGFTTTSTGTTWLAQDGSGVLTALAVYGNDSYGVGINTDVVTGGAGGSTNSLRFNTAAATTVTLTGTNTLDSGGLLVTTNVGANASTISGGTLTGTAASGLNIIQNNASGTLTIDSIIADNGGSTGLTKSGNGTVTLTGANTYSGGTVVNQGTLITLGTSGSGVATALPGGTLQIGNGTTNGTIPTFGTNAGTIIIANGSAQTFGTTFNAASNFNFVSNAIGNSTTFQSGSFQKLGNGTLTLTNALATNSFHPRAGTTVIDTGGNVQVGNFSSIGLNSGDVGTLTVKGSGRYTVNGDLNAGDLSGSVGIVNVTDAAVATVGNFYLGKNGSGAGILNLSGFGSFSIPAGGDRKIGGNAGADTAAYGAIKITAGTFNGGTGNFQPGTYGKAVITIEGGVSNFGAWITPGRFSTGTGVFNMQGGVLNATNTGTRLIVGENGTGVANVGVLTSSVPQFSAGQMFLAGGLSSGNAGGNGNTNLWHGGLINAATFGDHNADIANGTSTFNFHGGTIQARAATTTFFGGGAAATFNGTMTNAYVYQEGAVIDSNSFAITIPQTLIAPTGSGLSAIALGTAGSGYKAEPVVVITGGGGTGATARAILDGTGTITGYQITNPGVGYTSAPTITLSGGVPTVAGVPGAASTAANVTTGGLTKIGTGVLTLTGTNTYGGATRINGGGITESFSTVGGTNILPATGLILNGGNLTAAGFAAGTNTQTFSGTTISGVSSVTSTIGAGGTMAITLGAITRTAGGTADFSGTGTINTLTANTGTSILGGWATHGGGANWAVSAGTGSVAGNITALGTYTNDTWAAANNTTVTASTTAAAAPTNSLRFNNAGAFTVTLNGASVITTGGVLVTPTVGNNASIITGGTSLAAGTNNDLVVHQYNTGNTLAINSVIAANGTGGLVKAGGGVLILGNAVNTYNGNTVVGAGTLRLSVANDRAIPNGAGKGDLIINAGATFDLNGFDETVNGLSGFGTITSGINSNKTITVGDNNASSTFSGVILNGTSTANVLTKIGSGTLTLNNLGANTYTGNTNINAGAISIAVPNALSNNTQVIVGVAGGLKFDTTIPTISGLGGNANFTLQTQATSPLPNAPVQLTLGNNNFNGANFIGAFTGSGSVIKIGSGIQTLSGNNTNTGGYSVNAGTLVFSGNNSGASGQMFANTGGTIQINSANAFVGTGRSVVLASGGNLTLTAGSGNPALANFGALSAALSKIDQGSTGTLALQTDGSTQLPVSENLDFSASGPGGVLDISLGAMLTGNAGFGTAPVQYTGVITPNANTFRLGGGGGRLILPNSASLAGANGLHLFGGSNTGGMVFLTGAYGFTSGTFVNGGTTVITNLAAGGTASSLGAGGAAASNLVLNGGTLQYVGLGSTTDRLFTLSAGPTILDSSGSGPVNFTNTGAVEFLNAGNRTFTLQGNNTGANTIAAAFGDSINVAGTNGTLANGITTLQKNGNGTWVLSGNNTFSGGVNINNGVLGFTSTASIGANTLNGPGSVLVGGSGAVALLGSLQSGIQTTLKRISPLSTGTVALTADSAESINFDGGSAGAVLPNVSLGAYGNVNYTGTLTPFSNTYRLGGGGGTLTIAAGGLTGPRQIIIGGGGPGAGFANNPNLNGAVVLGGTSDFSGGTIINSGAILSATSLTALGTGPLKFQGGFYRAINATDITLASDGTSAREIRVGFDGQTGATANVDVANGVNLVLSKEFGIPVTLGSNQGQTAFTKWGAGSLTLAGLNLGNSNGSNSVATNSGALIIERGTLMLAANPTNYNGVIRIGSDNGGVATMKLAADGVFSGSIAQFGSGAYIDTYSGSNLDLNGKVDTIRLVRGTGSIINTGASTANLTIGTNNEIAIIMGNLVGDFTLTRAGTVSPQFGTGSINSSTELWNPYNTGFTGRLVANVNGIRIRSAGTLGSTTEGFKADKITLGNGGTLYTTGNNAVVGANHGITLNNGGILWSYGNGSLVVNSPIAGTGGLTIADDPGVIVLGGSNTYTGGTIIDSNAAGRGQLMIGAGGTTGVLPAGDVTFNSGVAMARLFINRADNVTVSNTLVGPGVLVQIGGGTTTLNGNNQTGQATQIAAGLLKADFSTGNQPIGSGTAMQIGGGGFEYVAPAGDNTLRLGALTLTAPVTAGSNVTVGGGIGDTVVQSTYGGSGAQSLIFTNLTRGTSGVTVNFITSGGTNGTTNSIGFTPGASPAVNNVIGAAYYFGSDFAAVDGGFFVRAANYGVDFNTSPLNTLIGSRYAKLTASLAAQPSVSLLGLHLAGNGTNFTLNAAATLTTNGNPGALFKTGGGTSIIGGGAGATVNNNGQEFIVRTEGATDVLQIDVPIAGNGQLNKGGSGQLVLTAANTYAGSTLVTNGSILVTGNGVLGTAGGGGELRISTVAGQAASVTIDSATASILNGNGASSLRIGEVGPGTLTQSAGTVTASNYLVLGESLGATGTYTMTGGTLNVKTVVGATANLVVGRAGTGTMNISGASTVNVKNGAQIQLGSGTVNSGQFQAMTPFAAIQSGVGTITQSGGSVNVDVNNGGYQGPIGGVILGVDGAGTYSLNGGTLTTPMLARGNGTAQFNLGGGTLKAASPVATLNQSIFNVDLPLSLTGTGAGRGAIDTNGQNVAITGPLTGTGGFVKTGTGTLSVLGSGSNFSGGTSIGAASGTIIASGTSLGGGNVEIGAGSTLQLQGVQTGLLGKFYLATGTPIAAGTTTAQTALTELTSLNSFNSFTAGKPLVAVESTAARGKVSVNYLELGGANGNTALPPQVNTINGSGSPFVADLRGLFNATAAGEYTFQTRSDDATILYIDGQPVLDNNRSQGQTTRSGTINLSAGQHEILIGYYQGAGGGGFSVGVTLPGQGQSFLSGSELNLSNSLLTHGSNDLTLGSLSGAGNVQLSSTRTDGTVNAGNLTIGVDNTNSSFSGNLLGGGTVNKVGTGVQTLSGTGNTYDGATNLSGGTLLLGADNVLPNATAFNLSGTAKFATGGFSDTTGSLSVLNAPILDLGANAGGSILTFANVSAWTGVLNVWNWTGAGAWTPGTDKILFSAGTENINLANVNFFSDGGVTPIGTGGGGLIGNELVPVPEPGAILAALLMLGAIGYRERRRRI